VISKDMEYTKSAVNAPLKPWAGSLSHEPLILDTPRGPWYLGEDYAFCERARRCGIQVFADTTIRLRHYGRFGFSWEEAGSAPPRYATYRFKADDGE
jgi:hypothetical protein